MSFILVLSISEIPDIALRYCTQLSVERVRLADFLDRKGVSMNDAEMRQIDAAGIEGDVRQKLATFQSCGVLGPLIGSLKTLGSDPSKSLQGRPPSARRRP